MAGATLPIKFTIKQQKRFKDTFTAQLQAVLLTERV